MWWKDYVKLNQKFAQKIIEIYQPGDISMSHLILFDNSLDSRLLSCSPTRNDQERDPKCLYRDVHACTIPVI